MTQPLGPPRPPHFAEHVVLGRRFRVARWFAQDSAGSHPLVFFSGIGANIELLAPFLARLHGRDVITFDPPGVGESPPSSGPYRLSSLADATKEILADLGLNEVDVMGVSWGGMLAQEFAYRHPVLVNHLVLAATSCGMPMIPGNLSTLIEMVGSHRYTDPTSIQPYLHTLYGGSDRDLDTYAARMTAPTSKGYWHQLLAAAGWTSVRKLTRVRAKTLILMGEEDRLLPPVNGRILKFLLNDARLEVLDDAGHLFVLTHMEGVVRMIEDFLGDRTRKAFCRPVAPRPLASAELGV